ncbi:MAG: hypothetical protein WD795_19820 [Woeseia sp.]
MIRLVFRCTGRDRTPVTNMYASKAGALLLLLAVGGVHADNEDEIARCARISSTGDRIICLEDALRRPDDRENNAIAELATEDTAAAWEPAGKVPAAVQEADEMAGEGAAHGATAGTTRSAAVSSGTDAEAVQRFGLEDMGRDAELAGSIEVVVVEVGKNVYKKLVYTTEDGQVWQQSDQRSPRYRDLPFRAEIRRAAAGSFFLQPVYGGIAVRVQRKQ